MDHQYVRKVNGHGQGRQVLDGVVGQFHHVRRNGQGPHRTQQQDTAIGWAAGGELVRNVAASAGFVFYGDRNAQVLAQALGDDPRTHVGRTARHKAHDHGDVLFGWEFLRQGGVGLQAPDTCQQSSAGQKP